MITLIKPDGHHFDITQAVQRVEWSGSAFQAARQLSVEYLNAPYDSFDLPQISTGDMVSFVNGGEELFYGQFFGSERSSAIGTITFTAFDMMRNLLESTGQYSFKNLPPEIIAKMVCDDVQVPVRYLYPTGINIASMICDNMSIYDIIMAAYTKAHRITGAKYYPAIEHRGLCVYRTEWLVAGFELSAEDNLLEASIEETMEKVVNRIRVFDSSGTQTHEVSDANSMARYGTFQQLYTQEKGVDPIGAATAMLSTMPAQTIKVKAIGDAGCRSCRFVAVADMTTRLKGRYWISSDKHTWESGSYTMELDLTFDSLMEETSSTDEGAVG